jgi:hypothetical protein
MNSSLQEHKSILTAKEALDALWRIANKNFHRTTVRLVIYVVFHSDFNGIAFKTLQW